MGLNIFYMSEYHLDAVSQLEKACFSRAWSKEALTSELDNPNACFLVAEENGKVLGYIGCIFVCGEGSITNVAVSPLHRRRGIGSLLISELIENAKKEQIKALFLEVRCSNFTALELYKKHGFSICGRRKNFYRDPVEDAYIMNLLLK